MEDLSTNWHKWKEFSRGKSIVVVAADEYDIFHSTKDFHDHRQYVRKLFADKGMHVTRFGHEYGTDGQVRKWGLVFARADSEIRALILVKGIVDENIVPIKEGVPNE